MRVYVDSSALVKRTVAEAESSALKRTLAAHSSANDLLVSSALSWVEVSRAVRTRLDTAPPAELVDMIEEALSGVLEVPLSEGVVSVARRLGPASLRSLDAIHLASATLLGADTILTYDKRMIVSAAELGFATSSPV